MAKPAPTPPQLNPIRLKTNLKMAISKLKFIQDKKLALTKQQRRQLADLLRNAKESSARIRVENIIRDDIYIELLEIIELHCELLLARINILLDPAQTECNHNLLEAVESIIYSAPFTELKEMTQIKDILSFKYGSEFQKEAVENKHGHVPEKIIKRCKIDPPSEELVNLYLCEIARAYNVPYSGLIEEETDNQDNDEDGGSKELSDPSNVSDKPSVATSNKPDVNQNDFDALKARFAALKS